METTWENILLMASILLAVLTLLKQLRSLGSSGAQPECSAPAERRSRPPAGTVQANPSKSIRKRFGASLRGSAMHSLAHSPGVSRGGLQSTPAKSKIDTTLFSPPRDTSDSDPLFLELLKIITYDDQLEQSAYGFSLSTKKGAGDDSPWVDKVLPNGPACTKLNHHDRISRINSENTQGWSADRAKQAILASAFRLYLDVVPAVGGDARQEVLYRGRLGRLYVLSQRCKGDEESETSRALLHFAVLLEQARSLADLRDGILERRSDTVSVKERDVYAKILAHAIPNADSPTLEPPGGPANLSPGNLKHRHSTSAGTHPQGTLSAASPLRVSMLAGTPSSIKEGNKRNGEEDDHLKVAEMKQVRR